MILNLLLIDVCPDLRKNNNKKKNGAERSYTQWFVLSAYFGLKVSKDTTTSTRKLMGTKSVNEKDVIQPFIYYNKRLKYKASLVQIWELVTVKLCDFYH